MGRKRRKINESQQFPALVFCTIGVGGTGPSCSFVLEKLFHFSRRKIQGTAQEHLWGLMRSQRRATRGDSLGDI